MGLGQLSYRTKFLRTGQTGTGGEPFSQSLFLSGEFWTKFSENPHACKFPKEGQFQMKYLLSMNSL